MFPFGFIKNLEFILPKFSVTGSQKLQRQIGRLEFDGDTNPGQHHFRELARDSRVPRGPPLPRVGAVRGQPSLGGPSHVGQLERSPIPVHVLLSEHAGLATGHRGHGRRDQVRI